MLTISKPVSPQTMSSSCAQPGLNIRGEGSRYVSRTLKNPDDRERLSRGIVDDQVSRVMLNCPESKGALGQILPGVAAKRPLGEKVARFVNGCLDPIGGVHVILGDVAPDFEKVFRSLGSKAVEDHPLC